MSAVAREFTHRFTVNVPLEAVADFHRDTRALRRLTPPPVIVQFHLVEPLAEGSRADFTLWLGPIPVRWVALHSQVDQLHGFTDTQLSGPFKEWIHRHSFQSVDEQTTAVIDQVQAAPGSGLFHGLVSRFMWLNLRFMFAYRAWITRRALENKVP